MPSPTALSHEEHHLALRARSAFAVAECFRPAVTLPFRQLQVRVQAFAGCTLPGQKDVLRFKGRHELLCDLQRSYDHLGGRPFALCAAAPAPVPPSEQPAAMWDASRRTRASRVCEAFAPSDKLPFYLLQRRAKAAFGGNAARHKNRSEWPIWASTKFGVLP